MEGEDLAAVFLRSDPEHHSVAAFRAPESRPDHHCYETGGWMDIRDWGDRMASLRIPLWWGRAPRAGQQPVLHDRGSRRPQGRVLAELELMPQDMAYRTWPHEQRTLNLWGSAWMRS
jgi:hypothetical protein